ncbi:hypothetical protein CU098_013566, partial [Rhizopus stolonifer]
MQTSQMIDAKHWQQAPDKVDLDNRIYIEKDIFGMSQGNKIEKHHDQSKDQYFQSSSSSSSVSSMSSSGSTTSDTLVDRKDLMPRRVNEKEIKRIERNLLQRLDLHVRAFLSMLLSIPFLVVLVVLAVYQTTKMYLLDLYYYKTTRPQESQESLIPDEVLTNDETYYTNRWGYESEMHEVETQDGHILKVYRIYKKGSNPEGKRPILIGHGLFQCSGAFVLNEEKSLAFTLAEKGYDVWVGNNRSIGGFRHVSLSHKDPEYWNWGLKELGLYDFQSMIDHVREYSGFDRVGYIGHSQGNAQAFIALSLCPEIGNKLSCFVALAPAVFSGHLVDTFPLRILINLNDWLYSLIFAQTMIEPRVFCFLAYSMFSYLFSWWDSHWLRRRKAKYFQFTPRPVSSRLIADWIAGWGRKGICLYVGSDQSNNTMMIKKK